MCSDRVWEPGCLRLQASQIRAGIPCRIDRLYGNLASWFSAQPLWLNQIFCSVATRTLIPTPTQPNPFDPPCWGALVIRQHALHSIKQVCGEALLAELVLKRLNVV